MGCFQEKTAVMGHGYHTLWGFAIRPDRSVHGGPLTVIGGVGKELIRAADLDYGIGQPPNPCEGRQPRFSGRPEEQQG